MRGILERTRKAVAVVAIVAMAALSTGCANSEVINGVEYQPYGIFDMNEVADPNVNYKISVGNVILAVIFFETLIVPIVIVGWWLYEPVGPRYQPGPPANTIGI